MPKCTAPCGICCEHCILYKKGICPGCELSQEKVDFLKSINANCPILECAVKSGKDLCSDCEKFPCEKFENWPFVKEWTEMIKSRLKSGE
ncbi:MAG: hypothetical protein COX34_02105 [Candidatus Nealsonbacteria bacterium CG23_combo_of_CG06-09_8_20_14_all_36_12]|uniref:DUF3795 domain-containing protein n=1 Tax=Candidatus Nealsonbacteria bacterium CG23_combo_of_CG06-09_8_20_14_all_36_12 TaxID=1974718 RepID=A0A2G9Z003_9BACT|nr:MAG: hypothetical protein COX34_02105 [Candidatus Nealsonbacteria bacterium CG23_combo_of_CG06-09_8_20_14_all_36_12]